MTDTPTLSGEEIEALMQRFDPGLSGRGGGNARPFTFGEDTPGPSTALPALDRIHERLARRLQSVLEPFTRTRPRIAAEPAVQRSLSSWQVEQGDFAGIGLYQFKPLKGLVLLSVPADLVSRLVDIFYGGSGVAPTRPACEFTPTEESLLGRLSDKLIETVAETWREVAVVHPQLKARESSPHSARMGEATDQYVVCRFTIAFAGGKPSIIDILYPAAGLRALEGAFTASASEEGCTRGEEWRERLACAVGDVRVDARTVLARPELSLTELMQLSVGDVIPVTIPALVPLLVEGRTVALGSIGEHDGKAALKIDRIETRRLSA